MECNATVLDEILPISFVGTCRHPGVVTVTILAPVDYLKKAKLYELVKNQYEASIGCFS